MTVSQSVETLRSELAELETRRAALGADLSQAEAETLSDEVARSIRELQAKLAEAEAKAVKDREAGRAKVQARLDEAVKVLDGANDAWRKARDGVTRAERRLDDAQSKLRAARGARSAARDEVNRLSGELGALQ